MGGQTGPVFYIYYEGMRHPPPILTRKKEFDLSKRKHGPTIVPALSAKVDNKKTIHSGWKLTAPLRVVPRTQHRSRFLYFCMAMESGGRKNFILPQKDAKSTGSRLPACGSTSTSWKLPVLSESIPESQHASQTDMNFA